MNIVQPGSATTKSNVSVCLPAVSVARRVWPGAPSVTRTGTSTECLRGSAVASPPSPGPSTLTGVGLVHNR